MFYNILEDYDRPMPGEGPFFTDYLWKAQAESEEDVGLDYIDWHETKYTYLAEHKNDLVELFDTVYKYRELGSETIIHFQDSLQQTFMEIADKYNHAYKVTEENDVDKLGIGYTYKEIRTRTINTTGTSSNTESNDSKFKDTPSSGTSTLNNPTNQTIEDNTSTGNATTNENLSDNIERDNTRHDVEMVQELSTLIDRYRQLDVEFVKDFENCFIGILQP